MRGSSLKIVVALIATSLSSSASSQLTASNPFASLTAEERPLVTSFAIAYELARSDPKAALAALDALLPSASKPTKFRGMIQLIRAGLLMNAQQIEVAGPVISEAIRLLPDDATAKLVGSQIYTFTGDAGQAADLWLAASRLDPNVTRVQDKHFMMALLGRLDDSGDRHRAETVRARLIDIGFSASSLSERSGYAVSVMRNRLSSGNMAGARELIPAVHRPTDLAALLADKKFEPLWPNIESWGGADLDTQWKSYLDLTQQRWLASKSLDAGLEYARALEEAGDPTTIVSEFESSFSEEALVQRDYDAQFLATPLARALIAVGRADEAFFLYAKLAVMWPYTKDLRGLNISGNWAQQELEMGQPQKALDRIDGVIRNATSRGPEVNSSALAAMHSVRICALQQLSRSSEAGESMTIITAYRQATPTSYMAALSCMNDRQRAKEFLLARLAHVDDYPFALDYVQPRSYIRLSPYLTKLRQFQEDLAIDRDVLKAVSKVGRKLSFPISGPRPAS